MILIRKSGQCYKIVVLSSALKTYVNFLINLASRNRGNYVKGSVTYRSSWYKDVKKGKPYSTSSKCINSLRYLGEINTNFSEFENIVQPPHGSVTSLHTDQEISGSIPDSNMECFSSGELFHSMSFTVVCPFSVLCCLRRRSLHFNDHRSGKTLELCPCF